MSCLPFLFDPEIEALLREIASDPKSSLLRFARPRTLRRLFSNQVVGRGAAWLTKAERHLLDVHRLELAWALREACLIKFLGQAGFGPWIGRNLDLTRGYRVESRERWRELFEQELARGGIGEPGAAQSLAGRPDWLSCSVSHLASISLQLEATDQARIYLAIDLALAGATAAARRVLHAVLEAKPTDEHASFALQVLALCASAESAHGEASDLARQSAARGPQRPEPHLNGLFYALMSADRRGALECARRIDSLMAPDHPAALLFERQLRAQRRAGAWRPSAPAQACARAITGELGRTGRRIARVLQ